MAKRKSGREWTPEERKAFGEKMRAARERKVLERTPDTKGKENDGSTRPPEGVTPSPSAPEINEGEMSVSDLVKYVKELEKRLFFQQASSPPQAQVTAQGIRGTVVKHSINPRDYPDPRDRLFDEPRLKLKDFNRNWWDLEFTVTPVRYDTKDGVHVTEPKFQLRLIRIRENEEGEPSNQRYILWKGTFFEDPEAAMQVAAQYGIEVPAELEKSFLDEMRYLRMRDWLLEAFYPPKPSQAKTNMREMVINNRLVTVYEANSENSETIPFGSFKKKL